MSKSSSNAQGDMPKDCRKCGRRIFHSKEAVFYRWAGGDKQAWHLECFLGEGGVRRLVCRYLGHPWRLDADVCERCGITGNEFYLRDDLGPDEAYWRGVADGRRIDRRRAYMLGYRRGARWVIQELRRRDAARGGLVTMYALTLARRFLPPVVVGLGGSRRAFSFLRHGAHLPFVVADSHESRRTR